MGISAKSISDYIDAEIEWHKSQRGKSGKSEDFEEGFISAMKHIAFFASGNYWLCQKCKRYCYKNSRCICGEKYE